MITTKTKPTQNTKTKPKLTPNKNPPPNSPPKHLMNQKNNFYTTSSTLKKKNITTTKKNNTITKFLKKSSNNPNFFNNHTPKNINTIKLTINPTMITNNFHQLPITPPTKIINNTKKTHNKITIINPTTKPIPIKTNIYHSK